MSLRHVNLNLLPMLQALLREQSVSAAADALRLTQPAVSAALARLRVALDDPLLVKAGRGMELTSRARSLIPQVDEACDAVSRVWSNQPFEPATAIRTFIIASADHGPLVIAPPLLRHLQSSAPRITLHFIDFVLEHLLKPQDRRVEFMIAPRSVFDGIEHDSLEIVQITSPEEFVGVIGPGHRLHSQVRITQADLVHERFVIFHPGPARAQELVEQIAGHLPGQFAVARFQQFTILPIIASLTQTLAIVPRRVAERLQEVMKIRIIENPSGALHTDLCLAWSPVYASDPGHRWLRHLIQEVLQ